MASSVSSVYLHVIEDVINKVRDEFINSGAGESVLGELQALWEAKMMQCGVISPNMERPSLQKQIGSITPVHDLNVLPMEEYETPTAELLFPPTPMQTPIPQTPFPQTPIQTPLSGTEQMYSVPTDLSDNAPVSDFSNDGDVKAGRPSQYMPPPSPWMNQRPLGVDVNVAYVEGREEVDRVAPHHSTTQDFFMMSSGKRKRDDYAPHMTSGGYMTQQDGAGDMTIEFLLPKENQLSSTRLGCSISTQHLVGTPKPTKTEAAEDDEPPLNEDDDDEDDVDDFDQGEEEPNTQHLVLAQFEKVTRTKSRWKCTLKDGIMHINGRDILFNKANGEFDF